MDPFAVALDAQFFAPGSSEAVYIPVSGPPPADPIRVIRSQPDEEVRFGDGSVIQGTNLFLIRRSEVAAPQKGGKIISDGATFTLRGEAMLDVEGLTWRMGATAD